MSLGCGYPDDEERNEGGKGKGKERIKGRGEEPKGKERKPYFLATKMSKTKTKKKNSEPPGLLITLYAVKIFDVCRLLMSGAMKNA